MKNTIWKNRWRSGMTRPEFLLVTCILLIGIYMIVLYQKSGEVLKIHWGKSAVKTDFPVQTASTETRISPTDTNSIPQIQEVTISVSSTNVLKKTINQNIVSPRFEMRLAAPKKHQVQLPTNAVWRSQLPRRGPGVRIAFP